MNEFSVIEKYFLPLTQGRAEALRLKDDAALLQIPKGYELAVTSDTLNAGTHFLIRERPEFIAHKALRTNLSDLAAMGARPYAYQMCVTFPQKPKEPWLKSFTAALLKDQKEFGIFCSGGDTTSSKGLLSVSITAFGLVPKGKAVKRSGAKPGDALVITGPVGDAWIGLNILQKKLKINSPSCIKAYRSPTPRTNISEFVRTYANAAIDVSDGLIADVGHICTASKLSARIDLQNIKFSTTAQKLLRGKKVTVQNLLTGGDDYELALAVPQKKMAALLKNLVKSGLSPQVIGKFERGKANVAVYDKTGKLDFSKWGWIHF